MKKILLGLGGAHILLILAGIFVLGGATFFAKHGAREGTYCSPDGTFSDEMPIQSHRSYCIKSEKREKYGVNSPSSYSFSIVDDQGNTLKDFATVHEKIMHVMVVRKDLAEFQHVHPEFDTAMGTFTFSDLNFPSDGPYRIFADFTPKSQGLQLGVTTFEDIKVGDQGKYKAQEVLSSSRDKMFEGYKVKLAVTPELTSEVETKLSYIISKDGKPVTNLENYLGALGHAVMLHEGDLQFVHAHPTEQNGQSGTIEFGVHPTSRGMYKVFMQFAHEGKIMTTDFTLTAQGEAVDHSQMGH